MEGSIYLIAGVKRDIPRSHISDEWSDTRGQGNLIVFYFGTLIWYIIVNNRMNIIPRSISL